MPIKPVFFYIPRNTSIEKQGMQLVTKTTEAEKQRCTVMLAVTADGGKLPPYVIFKRKTLPKGIFHLESMFKCRKRGGRIKI
jgi:hypothetical protein